MGVPMVKTCCYCGSLHIGTLIIGYFYSFWALLELAAYSLLVTLAPLSENGVVSIHKYVLYIVAAVVNGIQFLFSVLLVVAAYKKLSYLTLPWTILTGILTALVFMISLTGLSLILQDTGELLEIETAVIAVHFARACISVYCIIVVHSRHKQIMLEKDEERFLNSGRVYKPIKTSEDNN
ncbi:uncharacterized protein LOC113229252 [Hyposmocoma kahamanoa]|uniref:uncharacterized protein LOC113229252 n=1 Tax=Hyposmocoma kahamanoa TaxID=1477025 RepID=UPI000E6D7689|nr:uncharacterized protein LOC113229252 [Hyposmocoma kahamanoa]